MQQRSKFVPFPSPFGLIAFGYPAAGGGRGSRRADARPTVGRPRSRVEGRDGVPSETVVLSNVPVDGRPLRDRPLRERFQVERKFDVRAWIGNGILMVSPHSAAHSLWRFTDDDGRMRGWYANLEAPHWRSPRATHTRDHVLDVWFDADGTCRFKDEDELAAGVWRSAGSPSKTRLRSEPRASGSLPIGHAAHDGTTGRRPGPTRRTRRGRLRRPCPTRSMRSMGSLLPQRQSSRSVATGDRRTNEHRHRRHRP